MPEIRSDFPRAWIEFTDPTETSDSDNAIQIIRADLTWLTSRWQCTYGSGCRGIDANLPYGGCCTMGAHFADADDEVRVGRSAAHLTEQDWELKPSHDLQRSDWIETDDDGEAKTKTDEGACVFLNGPHFASGPGCALHVLAKRIGESHVRTKPDVCWQLPIRREYEERERADGVSTQVVVITEYVRGMWGEGGHDLDWYCSSNTEAHSASQPVYVHSKPELVELIGAAAYAELSRHCEAHDVARSLLPIAEINHGSLAPHPADPIPAKPDPEAGAAKPDPEAGPVKSGPAPGAGDEPQ